MKITTVAKLKASLSEYLRSVKSGEEILATERGQPIARLVPPTSSNFLPDELAEMEKQGFIKIGSEKLPEGFWALPRPEDPKGPLLKAVLRERKESW